MHLFATHFAAVQLRAHAGEELRDFAVEFHFLFPEDIEHLRHRQWLAVHSVGHRHSQHTGPDHLGSVRNPVEMNIGAFELHFPVLHAGRAPCNIDDLVVVRS